MELIFLVTTFWNWNNLASSIHVKFDVTHDWTCDMIQLSKQLLIMVRDIASFSSHSLMFPIPMQAKLAYPPKEDTSKKKVENTLLTGRNL